MRRVATRLLVVGLVGLVVAGCQSADEGPTPSQWPQPTGEVLVVESGRVSGPASTMEFDGVSFSLPDGWETYRTEAADYSQLSVTNPNDDSVFVLITVYKARGDADTVEVAAAAAFATLGAGGAVTGLKRQPASWDGWAYATAITGTMNDEQGAEYLLVAGLSEQGLVVGASAKGRGALDGSEVLEVLKTVREAE